MVSRVSFVRGLVEKESEHYLKNVGTGVERAGADGSRGTLKWEFTWPVCRRKQWVRRGDKSAREPRFRFI